jgi:hypothetical protein
MVDVCDICYEEGVDDADDCPPEGGSRVEVSPKANGVLRGIDKMGCMWPLYPAPNCVSFYLLSPRNGWTYSKSPGVRRIISTFHFS